VPRSSTSQQEIFVSRRSAPHRIVEGRTSFPAE
jgi:hypothetical protein